ncbi:site-specific DNA-methyltransferase [Patescibacteria group bacterium]|nr:site-specific DNA-methyltransferase [Patescibacteria group bacterium]
MSKKQIKNPLKEIERLEKEIKQLKSRKKYGLVWESKPEEVVEMCKEKLPVLKEEKSREIKSDTKSPVNVLIEGDNYHSLSVLNYTHEKKIDVIYIDPPYNTGAKDWKYNNNFVDINDQWRHSKWLSMMEKRLVLAKKLLKADGVLICAIDENEVSHLGALLEEIFFNRGIHLITIVHNPRGIQGKNFSYTNEFAFFVLPKGKRVIGERKIEEKDITWRNLRDNGGESLRSDARNCFYPIIVRNGKVVGFGKILDTNKHPKKQTEKKNGDYYIWPIDSKGIERKWRYAVQSVNLVKHLLRAKKSKGGYEVEIGKNFGTVRTVWSGSRYDSNENGTKLVHSFVPKTHFDFPKSIYNIYDCIAPIIYERKNAIVLDYFAGSGTTGHALMMINKEDKGNRKFILCTNNENGISTDVCHPRLKKAITGHKNYPSITGFNANLKYYKTDFVDSSTTDKNKKEIVDKSTEMLCIKESCFNSVKKGKNFSIFKNNDDKYLGIVYDDSGIESFKKEVNKLKKKFIVYVFSLDDSAREEEFEDVSEWVEPKPIPAVILNVYKRVFR